MHQGSGEVQRGVSRKDSFIFSRPLTSRWTPFAERLKHANSRVSIRLSTTQQYNGVFYFSHHDQLLPLDTKVYVTWLKVSLSRPAWWWGKAFDWLLKTSTTFSNALGIQSCILFSRRSLRKVLRTRISSFCWWYGFLVGENAIWHCKFLPSSWCSTRHLPGGNEM